MSKKSKRIALMLVGVVRHSWLLRLQCARHGREHRSRASAAPRDIQRPARAILASDALSAPAPRRLAGTAARRARSRVAVCGADLSAPPSLGRSVETRDPPAGGD